MPCVAGRHFVGCCSVARMVWFAAKVPLMDLVLGWEWPDQQTRQEQVMPRGGDTFVDTGGGDMFAGTRGGDKFVGTSGTGNFSMAGDDATDGAK
ncbi:unnamed protein product [Didymodactylos carnosus]|uniref:Uncharacterized protein n=1 Tax=Didymodactylos carnosus TaxID=1234261 RepID=A0A815UH18_9BILA|nr:unnamed protein product [Didymodactylos carnosus]CAF4378636.1 unnamed protein product [Didymodactylos carnosus]